MSGTSISPFYDSSDVLSGLDKAQLAAITQNPIFLKMVQDKLGELVGMSSGYLESLPKQVQDRISVVQHLQVIIFVCSTPFSERMCRLRRMPSPINIKRN